MIPGVRRACEAAGRTMARFWKERTWRMAAAITFYALLSLGPLLALELQLAGYLMDQGEFQDRVLAVLEKAVGDEGADAVEDLLDNFDLPQSGWWSYGIGLYMLLFGGVNAVAQLRESMRTIWRDETSESDGRSGWLQTLTDAGFVFFFGVILLASVLLNSVLIYARSSVESDIPGGYVVLRLVDFSVSIGVLAVVFAVIFRVLPSKKLPWRSVATGAVATALLFMVARFLMILWLAHADIGSVYGSLTFFIVLMFWVYVSAQLLLFGASFTYEVNDIREAE